MATLVFQEQYYHLGMQMDIGQRSLFPDDDDYPILAIFDANIGFYKIIIGCSNMLMYKTYTKPNRIVGDILSVPTLNDIGIKILDCMNNHALSTEHFFVEIYDAHDSRIMQVSKLFKVQIK